MPNREVFPMLIGVGHSRLDSRRRLTLPAKYRFAMLDASESRGLVLVPWYEQGVAIYAPHLWDGLRSACEKSPALIALWGQAEVLGATIREVKVDPAGRFVLPAGFCSWMQVVPGSDQIELAGAGHHLLACSSSAAVARKRSR